jgi:hypothetical protein
MLSRRHVIAGLGGVAASMAFGGWPQRADARQIDKQDLLTFFDTLALMRGGDGDRPARPGRARKWTAPVYVRTRGAGAVEHRATVNAILDEISELTDIPFRRASRVAPRDNLLTVYFMSGSEMKLLYGENTTNLCYTQTRGRRGVLHTARLRIRNDFGDCLHHEFMHALGFDNHWPGLESGIGAPSALANRFAPERAHGFSDWDRMAIRLLYDPRLAPGTARDEALSITERIIPELPTS